MDFPERDDAQWQRHLITTLSVATGTPVSTPEEK